MGICLPYLFIPSLPHSLFLFQVIFTPNGFSYFFSWRDFIYRWREEKNCIVDVQSNPGQENTHIWEASGQCQTLWGPLQQGGPKLSDSQASSLAEPLRVAQHDLVIHSGGVGRAGVRNQGDARKVGEESCREIF